MFTRRPFWERKRLDQMTETEWESLCDGCGRCCLAKLENEDTGDIDYTDVACRLLNLETGLCRRYADRQTIVPDCVRLRPDNVAALTWMPSTCAYRLLAEGRPLFAWHPLLTRDRESVVRAGISVRGRVVSESRVWDLENRIVTWPA